jgi:uncharacterized protein (DUF2141 family)
MRIAPIARCAALATILSTVPSGAQPARGTIRVDVSTFRNQKGVLGCLLFARGESFPEAGALAAATSPIRGATATCTFANVAPGWYAVSVLHDEDADGKMRKSLFGAPLEGYGVSNNRTYAMSPPKWEESRFEVKAGETKVLAVVLRY